MTDNEKLDMILKFLREELNHNIDSVSPEDNLDAVGLDSLSIVEFQVYYEDITKKETPNKYQATTVDDLMRIM